MGDGILGLLEGFCSWIHLDGSQPMRYAVRNDCIAEVAMALAFSAKLTGHDERAKIAGNLMDFIYTKSPLAQGPRSDPASPSYGLIGWSLDSQDKYWGDDNARALLATASAAVLLDTPRWTDAFARCVLGNLRTTGRIGFRLDCITEKALGKEGGKPSPMRTLL